MVKVGLFAKLHAKPGQESALQSMLESALALANQEAGTTVWFALKFDSSTFGIFDAFAAEEGRQAHLTGQIAAALMAKAPELLSEAPKIEMVDVLAAKLSG
jgi:quinol monooxygenase YgiN